MTPISLLESCRHALRALARGRGFAAAVGVLLLGLGFGAVSAVFAFLDGLLRPLPFPHPERLVMLWEGYREKGEERLHVSPPNLADWSAQSRAFTGMAAFYETSLTLSGGS